jgi:SMP-30/Gluconolactonase/LRE-like region
MRRLVCLALVAALPAAFPAAAQAREPLDISVFTRVGQPGQPEPIAIGPDGLVYVGTNQLGHGDADAPSKVFAYSPAGELVREYVIEGQPLDQSHGIQGLLFDEGGYLYALDRSATPRVIRIDPATGEQQDYATFRDVPPCSQNPAVQCSQTVLDGPAGPDYGTFAPDGTMFVTDIDQGLIWRVRRGGGDAEVWFSDPRLESLYGPNGIQFMSDGRTLLFVNTASNPAAGNSLTGRLYTLPVQADEGPGPLTQVWESLPLDAPDGLAIARSGNVYVALAGSNQVVMLSPQFTEVARTPSSPIANQDEEIPMDGPGSIVFFGESLLVSNHSPIAGNPQSWAILDVFAGEEGLPLHYPLIYKPKLKLEVRLKNKKPRARAAGRKRVRIKAVVTRFLASAEVPVEGARVMARRKESKTNANGKATVKIRRLGKRPIKVIAFKKGFESARVSVQVLPPVKPRDGAD